MRVLVTGSTGFVGSGLCPFLRDNGYSVRTLSRTATVAPEAFIWKPEAGILPVAALLGCDAVVHLAGEGIADGRWTSAKKQRILRSRLDSTELLARTMAGMSEGPKIWISASGIGIYGSRGDEELSEDSSMGSGFLAEVCRQWESATRQAEVAGVRCVHLRLGVVLSKRGGALARMLPAFRCGLGGVLGSGDQYMSWVSAEDLNRVIQFTLERGSLRGAVNVVSPAPVTNQEFTRTLAQALRRPVILPVPAFVLRLLFGQMADEALLASTRAIPTKLIAQGFNFKAPALKQAFQSEMKSG